MLWIKIKNRKFKMMKKIKLIGFLLLFSTGVFAQQELLTPLYSNPLLKDYNHLQQNKIAASDTLNLPFIDDFSIVSYYPNENLWEDNQVYINSDYPQNALSVGVATFDGLNANGSAYDNSSASAYGRADELTSAPLNLYESGGVPFGSSDIIMLSFFVQRRGLGDQPEINDSLIVEFLDPINNLWHHQWGLLGGVADTSFNRVFIQITDSAKFFHRGFKFRFANYGSLTGNLDHWHIDFVSLRKQFSAADTLIDDIGFKSRGHSLLLNHTAIPWEHYKSITLAQQQSLMIANPAYEVKNNKNTTSPPVGLNDRIFDQYGNLIYNVGGGGGNTFPIAANSILNYSYPLLFSFPDTVSAPESYFDILDNVFVNTGTLGQYPGNDTIFYRQAFNNYYAYDDGTAEAGYSLINSPGGRIAYQFSLLKDDTLRGVLMHWTQMNANVSLKLFKAVVYSAISPSENIIYQQLNLKPSYTNYRNGFYYYPFDIGVPLTAGNFYVGFGQSINDALNLGFDKNTISNDRMFYNTTGTWNQSAILGSWMIRPVFGDSSLVTSVEPIANASSGVSIYPNPAIDKIYIKSSNSEKYSATLYDASGRLVFSNDNIDHRVELNSNLVSGFYILELKGLTSNRQYNFKVMIH